MAQALRSHVFKGAVQPRFFNRSTDNSVDSIRAIVGWTCLTVVAFWTPVALLAYVALS